MRNKSNTQINIEKTAIEKITDIATEFVGLDSESDMDDET